jgi:hypothetical protein
MLEQTQHPFKLQSGEPSLHRHDASWFGEPHDKPKGPQHQEKAEVQELRGQGAAEEGRQSGKMPALWRDRGAVERSIASNCVSDSATVTARLSCVKDNRIKPKPFEFKIPKSGSRTI